MIKKKTIVNPLYEERLQLILDENDIAEKNHLHQLSDITGLTTILNSLTQEGNINLGGGYFVN